jgi:hypothetical protein
MKVGIKELSTFEESIDQETMMYSQLSMAREPATDDCKPLGTHRTLGLISKIDELN